MLFFFVKRALGGGLFFYFSRFGPNLKRAQKQKMYEYLPEILFVFCRETLPPRRPRMMLSTRYAFTSLDS